MATIDSWEDARAFALSLSGTEAGTSYGMPSVQVVGNARSFIHRGGEPDTSFVVATDRDTIAILLETEPETYWQSAHYQGYAAVLVRFGAMDDQRVREVIVRARDQAASKRASRRK